MKQVNLLPPFRWMLFLCLLATWGHLYGQDLSNIPGVNGDCDLQSLQTKYWQYRENFNRHFVVIDREPGGCINDGIGQDPDDPCKFSKGGHSLPVTAIVMEGNGMWGMGNKAPGQSHWDEFCNCDCFKHDGLETNGISWDGTGRKNYAEFGSETLTQLGDYLVTLATEYQLLKNSGQNDLAQRTLEEIFLALQSIRRLDMTTQCMISQMWESKECHEPICPDPTIVDTKCHKHIYHAVKDCTCAFEPDMSGYNGFFLREDANQSLEDIYHDPNDEMYNVDAIGSAYSNSNPNPPCNEPNQFCYLASGQMFISQDQMESLLYGLMFVKKYVPASANVRLCNGDSFNVLEIAQNLAHGMVAPILDDPGRVLTIPGSDVRYASNQIDSLRRRSSRYVGTSLCSNGILY